MNKLKLFENYGELDLGNGSFYYGQCLDDLRNGYGKEICANG